MNLLSGVAVNETVPCGSGSFRVTGNVAGDAVADGDNISITFDFINLNELVFE
jgi:hypothetical protein